MTWAMRRQFDAGVVVADAFHLLLGEDVPQAELDPQLAVGLTGRPPDHQRLRVQLPPVDELRHGIDRRLPALERTGIDQAKQAGALQIGPDHLADVAADARRLRRLAIERQDRDRDRLDHAACDVDAQLRRRRGGEQQKNIATNAARTAWRFASGLIMSRPFPSG